MFFFHNLSQRFRLNKIFGRAASISCRESHYNITQLLWSDKNSFNLEIMIIRNNAYNAAIKIMFLFKNHDIFSF